MKNMFRFGKSAERIFFSGRALHHEHVFSAFFSRKAFRKKKRRALFVYFRDFAHRRRPTITENLAHGAYVGIHILRSDVKKERCLHVFIFFEKGAFFARFFGKKTYEQKFIGGQSG